MWKRREAYALKDPHATKKDIIAVSGWNRIWITATRSILGFMNFTQ